MRLKDGTILMHGTTPYDPVKAHAYYIKTRHLKGRRPGQNVPPSPARARGQNLPTNKTPTFTVTIGKKKTVLTQQQLADQRAFAEKRVAEIKTRLTELTTKLKALMADAQKPTAADKAKARRRSKQYRQSHKQQLANKAKTARQRHPARKTTRVAELQHKINQVKGSLKAAVEAQRALATASRNTG